jgi:AP-4 complex subunit mu-1
MSVVDTFYQRISEFPPPPPVFRIEALTYAYVLCNSLYFVVATTESMSPTLLVLLLRRITTVLSDYMGRCTEVTMQKNLALVYEVVDEVLSFGCPQATDSQTLLHLVHNEVPYEQNFLTEFIQTEIFPGEGFDRPLALSTTQRSKTNNEVFLIINEKISMTISLQNQVLQTLISGLCSCKSFLQGVPSCSLQIDPQCFFMSRQMPHDLMLKYDDITFSPFVQTTSFDSDRSISFVPPEGTSLIFTYRTQRDIQPPFLIQAFFENTQAKVVVVRISVQSTFPVDSNASDVCIHFQCPIETSNASCELPSTVLDNQSSDYDSKNRQVNWRIKKFGGLTEFSARFRFIFDNGIPAAAESLLGPISLDFTLIGSLPSGLNIKNFLVSTQGTSNTPHRWYKETANAGSYTFNFI